MNPEMLRFIRAAFGPNVARRAAGITEAPPLEQQTLYLSVALEVVDRDELLALREAVEVLEDMYAQRDAETERWFRKWMDEHSELRDARAAVRNTEAERDDYAARLKASNVDYIKLSRENEYHKERADKLRERIKTYKAALAQIVDGYDPFNYKSRVGDGLRRLAYHVLNSRIDDGGCDF